MIRITSTTPEESELLPQSISTLKMFKPTTHLSWLYILLRKIQQPSQWYVIICYTNNNERPKIYYESLLQEFPDFEIMLWDLSDLTNIKQFSDITKYKKLIYIGLDTNTTYRLQAPNDYAVFNDETSIDSSNVIANYVHRWNWTHLRHVLYLKPTIYGFVYNIMHKPVYKNNTNLVLPLSANISYLSYSSILYDMNIISAWIYGINDQYSGGNLSTLSMTEDSLRQKLIWYINRFCKLRIFRANLYHEIFNENALPSMEPMELTEFMSYIRYVQKPQLLYLALNHVYPVKYIERLHNIDQQPQIPYMYIRPLNRGDMIHWGQLKLLLAEIEFLQMCKERQLLTTDTIILYIGAASGQHIPFLAEMFPEPIYHLWDPSRFSDEVIQCSKQKKERFSYFNDYFTPATCEQYKGKKVIMINDMRKVIESEDEKHFQKHEDNDLQRIFVENILPIASSLKFYFMYSDEGVVNYPYFAGDIYIQAFAPEASTETRLIFFKDRHQAEWPMGKYESFFFYFNTVVRPLKLSLDDGAKLLGVKPQELDFYGEGFVNYDTWRMVKIMQRYNHRNAIPLIDKFFKFMRSSISERFVTNKWKHIDKH